MRSFPKSISQQIKFRSLFKNCHHCLFVSIGFENVPLRDQITWINLVKWLPRLTLLTATVACFVSFFFLFSLKPPCQSQAKGHEPVCLGYQSRRGWSRKIVCLSQEVGHQPRQPRRTSSSQNNNDPARVFRVCFINEEVKASRDFVSWLDVQISVKG